jgi:hypothetical protein
MLLLPTAEAVAAVVISYRTVKVVAGSSDKRQREGPGAARSG